MERESIRIRLIPRDPLRQGENPRAAFWHSMQSEDDNFDYLEGKLCSEFGPALRHLLITHLSAPLRDFDRMFINKFNNIDNFLFQVFERIFTKGRGYDPQILEAFTHLSEQREKFLRENLDLKSVRGKIAAASEVIFNVRITGYSSINLEMAVGGLKKLAEVFDNDFDSFRVFLDAFVPQAYAHVFNSNDARRLDSYIQIPDSFANAFVSTTPFPTAEVPGALPAHRGNEQSPSPARKRAEWLWMLANGSLLVPFLISLGVMYLGISTLHDIGRSQNEMIKPIFEHQVKLLEEDRRRLFKESIPVPPTTTPPIHHTQQ